MDKQVSTDDVQPPMEPANALTENALTENALTELLAKDSALGVHCTPLRAAGCTLAECYSLLAQGRPALLAHLKDAGISNIQHRQAITKAIAIAMRDPVTFTKARLPDLLSVPMATVRQPPAIPPGPIHHSRSRSQQDCYQDIRCLQFHGFKWGGYYLEIGVDNAVENNNTVILDHEYGWRGLCVDPNAPMISARSATFFQVALASRSGTASFSMGGPFSGLTEFVSSEEHNKKWYEMAERMGHSTVQTRTPLEVLTAAHAPREIDYMSLDVEGAEMEILRAFPFESYRILFSTIETNNDAAKEKELRSFMKSHGYVFLGHAVNDDYFCHSSADWRHVSFQPPLEYGQAV